MDRGIRSGQQRSAFEQCRGGKTPDLFYPILARRRNMKTRFVPLGLALVFLALTPATIFAGGQPAKVHSEKKTVSTAPPSSAKHGDTAFTK
jgi:hypothetical protein